MPLPSPTRASLSALFLLALTCAAQSARAAQDPPPPTPETSAVQAQATRIPEDAPNGILLIDQEHLQQHAGVLASDAFGGRYTGSAGQVEAANYIAGEFERVGLQPLGERTQKGWAFLQRYPVERTELDHKRTKLTLGGKEFEVGFAVVPGKKPGPVDVRGRFVWCGTGARESLPKGLGGAIPVVVMAGTGGQGRALRDGFRSMGITRALEDRGAKAVVYCLLEDTGAAAEVFNYSGLLAGKPALRYGNEGRALPTQAMPAMIVNRAISEQLLAAFGIDLVQGEVKEPKTLKRVSGRVQILVKEDAKSFATNVVGFLEGRDPQLKSEAIVFSAHMDHMGTRIDGDVFNGADDNASGSSGLLELAEAFGKGARPARSVLFVSVSGEEEGLWGSHWFSENPTWPLAKIVANINIDMIGRTADLSGPRGISVTPSHSHEQFNTLVKEAVRLGGLLGVTEFTSGDKFYQRSDHYNFARKGIPVVFFCDGEHEDYHKVTDHADKLDYAKMELITRLAYWVGYNAADARERPKALGSQTGW